VNLRRYVLPEVVGTVVAVAVAWLLHRLSGSAYAAAWGGSLAEMVGYYGVVLWRDAAANRRAGAGRLRTMARLLPATFVEFGPAELLDTLLVRPAFMYAGPAVLGVHEAFGILVGKLAADVLFYAIVLPCRQLRLCWFPERVRTPYLMMNLDAVERAHTAFREAMPDVTVHYAVKCNPDPAVLRRLHKAGCSFEIASAAELVLLRKLGVKARDVLYSNPVKPAEHIAETHRMGVRRFAADSAEELAKLAEHAPGSSVYMRLRTRTGGGEVGSEGKFGVEPSVAADLLRSAKEHGLEPYGLTFHVGSQTMDPTVWTTALWNLTGPTCDSQDTILHDVELSARLRPGDTVRLHVAGAYTCAYASRFNGFDIPEIVH
jgi:hypothetical protein